MQLNTIILNSHILGAGFLLAVLVFAIFLLIKKPFAQERLGWLRTLINTGVWTIVWLMLSGAFLFTDRPQTFATGVLFWIKIGLFILDLIVGLVLVNRQLKAKTISSTPLIAWAIFNLIVAIVIIAFSIMINK